MPYQIAIHTVKVDDKGKLAANDSHGATVTIPGDALLLASPEEVAARFVAPALALIQSHWKEGMKDESREASRG